jgi:HSP20 family protein
MRRCIMAILRWRNEILDPMNAFEKLQDEINKLFDFRGAPANQGLFDRAVSPPIDVAESEDAYAIYCDLPGVKLEDIEISIASNVLTIKGEKTLSGKTDTLKVYKRETWEGAFQRTLSLPSQIDSEKVEAIFTDGVLKITLQKKEEVKPKQIKVITK